MSKPFQVQSLIFFYYNLSKRTKVNKVNQCLNSLSLNFCFEITTCLSFINCLNFLQNNNPSKFLTFINILRYKNSNSFQISNKKILSGFFSSSSYSNLLK